MMQRMLMAGMMMQRMFVACCPPLSLWLLQLKRPPQPSPLLPPQQQQQQQRQLITTYSGMGGSRAQCSTAPSFLLLTHLYVCTATPAGMAMVGATWVAAVCAGSSRRSSCCRARASVRAAVGLLRGPVACPRNAGPAASTCPYMRLVVSHLSMHAVVHGDTVTPRWTLRRRSSVGIGSEVCWVGDGGACSLRMCTPHSSTSKEACCHIPGCL